MSDDQRRHLRAGCDQATADYQRTRPVCPLAERGLTIGQRL